MSDEAADGTASVSARQLADALRRPRIPQSQMDEGCRDLVRIQGWTAAQVAERLGISQPVVSKAVKRAEKLVPELKSLLDAGELHHETAYIAAGIDPVAQVEAVQAHLAGEITVKELQARGRKTGRGRKARTLPSAGFVARNGVRVIVPAGVAATAETLQEAFADIKEQLRRQQVA